MNEIVEAGQQQPSPPTKSDPGHVEEDYTLARQTLRDLVVTASNALDGIMKVADSSEHPRAYEVAAQLINSVGTLAKDLLDLQKKNQDIGGPTSASTTTIQNAVFVGSTKELQALLKKVSQLPVIDAEVIDGE